MKILFGKTNHHEEPLLMELYRSIKRRFISYRKGTYKDRVDRAYMELTEDINNLSSKA